MGKRAVVFAVTAVLVTACITASTLVAGGVRRGRRAVAQVAEPGVGKVIPQPAVIGDAPGDPRPMTVRVTKATPDDLRALHQQAATLMTKAQLGVPPFRLQQFRWLNDERFHLTGWSGAVDSVQQTPNGYTVTLLVTPLVKSSMGASTTVLSSVREQYTITPDGGVTFVQPLSGIDDAPMELVTD